MESFLNQPSHALAISGQPGAGKTEVARYIVARLLNVPAEKVTDHPYVMTLNAEEEKSGIDDVRRLREFLSLTVPGHGKVKRAVQIFGIDQLRHEAQNALLKTVEEPPADTIIVATINSSSHVLSTLQSRMQAIQVLPVDYQAAEEYFLTEFNKDLILKNYHIGGGLPGLMSALLAEEHNPVTAAIEQARGLLRLSRYQRLSAADSLLKNKHVTAELLLDAIFKLVSAGYKQAILSHTASAKELKAYVTRLRLVTEAINDLRENVQAKLVLSRLMLNL